MCGKTADIQIPVVKTPNCVWSYEEHPTPLGLYPLALLSIKFTSSMTTEPLPHDFFKLPSIPPPPTSIHVRTKPFPQDSTFLTGLGEAGMRAAAAFLLLPTLWFQIVKREYHNLVCEICRKKALMFSLIETT